MTQKPMSLSSRAFQIIYHDFAVSDRQAAIDERDTIKVDDDEVVVVGPLLGRYCLMLKSAAVVMNEIDPSVGIVS